MKSILRLLTAICLLTLISSCFPHLEKGPVIGDEQKTFDFKKGLEELYSLSPKSSDTTIKKKRALFQNRVEYSAECSLAYTKFVNQVIIESEKEEAVKGYRAHRAALIERQKKKGLLYRNSNDFFSYGELSHYMEFYPREEKEHPELALFTFRRGRVIYSMQVEGRRAPETAKFEQLVKERVKLLEKELSGNF